MKFEVDCEEKHMKFVVIGEPSGASREAIMAKFSRYKAVVDAFVARATAAPMSVARYIRQT